MVIEACGLTAGKLLDIGCGTGHFMSEMKNAGWSVSGIEINEKARKYASDNFNLEVFPPEGMKSLPDMAFDCITLWHVLEHFHEPFEYFTEISRLLKPGGKVLVALPNSSSCDASHYGKDWAAYDVPRHLWHFAPSTFSAFATKTGFEIVSMKMLPLDVFYISILSEKNRRTFLPAITGLIKGSFFFFLSLFNIKKGSSIVYTINPA